MVARPGQRAPGARVAAIAMLVAGAMGACAPVTGSSESDGLGVRHAYWRADDRLLISDFSQIGAVSADRRFVFGASEHGVVVYDHRMQRWEAPLTVEDGFPRAELPIALEVDELTGLVWMVTRTGALWAYDVSLGGEWRWVGVLPGGGPVALATHEGSLWARTGSGWFVSAPGGGSPVRGAPPAEVEVAATSGLARLERQSAAFRASGSSLTVDEWLRRFEITSAAPAPDSWHWWLGTWGGGIWAYDDRMMSAQRLPYGTVGRGVSAIGATPGGGGLWFGSDGLDQRRGVAHASRDLQRWAWHESGRAFGAPAGTVHSILETTMGVFVGSQDGLYRLVGDRWHRLTDADDLPATSVRALAWAYGALWVGTERGLARVTAGSEPGAVAVTRIDGAVGTRINAIVQADSVLWIAGDRGLWSLDLESGTLAQPPLGDARLRGRVIGVAYEAPRLYALAESALLVFDGASWSAPPVSASLSAIGRPTHLAVRNGIAWIGGSAGALGVDPVTGAETILSVPGDIPEAPVRQVLPVDGGVWLATPAGALLLRFE